MCVQVNGARREVPAGLDVSGLLSALGVAPERVAVEVNLAVIERGQYGGFILNEGDQVEIISFVGGGRR